ncbi:phosphatase PAP2 family protein [Flavihumibacter fluvii]|uniref:phosphatase PAP2 family protein n=1 Tax=Flavihumibacter fluvii TaxID=2838157 RepID=UPI001BDEE4E0|nr:phosphatase PAP2 family protein [Flavihumibacter fluvii]ULQ53657.1 phosphatase PAP2 family protein [Flavihumibacter fluvii]
MDLIKRLIEFDKALMLSINSKWHYPLLDTLFQHIRETYFWLPLYLFFIVLAVLNFGKKGWLWVLVGIVTISITDQVSSNLIKGNIERLRPCRDPMLADQIRFFVRYCPGSSSFTSSHATNHFGFAAYVIFTLRRYLSAWIYALLAVAFMISYGQVYVGVHFPLDVVCGGLTGSLIGYGMSVIFNKKIGLQELRAN